MTVLRMENVSFGYDGAQVLHDVSLTVRAGESVALLGPNGVGKTTLTKLIVGLVRPAAGWITVGDGKALRTMSPTEGPESVAHQVGYVFQHPDQQLFARTVRDEVAFGPRQLGFSEEQLRESVDDVVQRLGLWGVRDRHPFDLPLPTRRLVTIASAIVHHPQLLILDEPVQGLDRRHVEIVTHLLSELTKENVASLVVAHDVNFAVEVCDRAVVLHEGQIGYDGPMAELVGELGLLERYRLRQPIAAEVGVRLGLEGRPVRVADVVTGIAQRIRAG